MDSPKTCSLIKSWRISSTISVTVSSCHNFMTLFINNLPLVIHIVNFSKFYEFSVVLFNSLFERSRLWKAMGERGASPLSGQPIYGQDGFGTKKYASNRLGLTGKDWWSPWRPERPRNWLSIMADLWRSVPITYKPPAFKTIFLAFLSASLSIGCNFMEFLIFQAHL